jgi:monofunctional biosynthetic peptidoglycan transglycosylase
MKRLALVASLLIAAGLLGLALLVVLGLPSREAVRALSSKNPGPTALMRQREAEARRKGRKARAEQQWVPLGQISRSLIQAVIAAEDQKFFGHAGVDWQAIQESLEHNVEQGHAWRGGSTLTQQLAKNLYFGTEKTVVRKLRELIVTRWLEQDLKKRRILEIYLNVIEWGDGVYGAQAGARRWYDKPAAALTADEAAGLAAMIPNPRRINPEQNQARHARATRRVLWLMAHAGFLERSTAGLGAEPPAAEPEDRGEDEEATP